MKGAVRFAMFFQKSQRSFVVSLSSKDSVPLEKMTEACHNSFILNVEFPDSGENNLTAQRTERVLFEKKI